MSSLDLLRVCGVSSGSGLPLGLFGAKRGILLVVLPIFLGGDEVSEEVDEVESDRSSRPSLP